MPVSTTISTVHICERCGHKLDTRRKLSAGTVESPEATFYETVRVDLCDRCEKERDELIYSLWNSLPWEQRGQFDSLLMDDIIIKFKQRGKVAA